MWNFNMVLSLPMTRILPGYEPYMRLFPDKITARIPRSLEAKFVGLATIIIAGFSLLGNTWVVYLYQNQILMNGDLRAAQLAQTTASGIINTLLYEELGLIHEGGLIENEMKDLVEKDNTHVKRMNLYDGTGHLHYTSEYSQFANHSPGVRLTPPFTRLVRDTVIWKGRDYEYYLPLHIYGKQMGVLQIVFSRQQDFIRIARFRHVMLWVSLVVFITGVILAFIIARTLARPIKDLAGQMASVRDLSRAAPVRVTRGDEIGVLQKSFGQMLERLKTLDHQREKEQQALIQTEKLASVGTLVSGLAHEINNPLAGIQNCLRRIENHPENIEQTRKYAQLMASALSRIDDIVTSLLNFTRKRDMSILPVNLNQILDATLNLLEMQKTAANIRFRKRLADPLPQASGDAQYLSQVVMNLLLNAMDEMPEGGEITLETGADESRVFMKIRDQGSGIPKPIQHKIFDPFFTTKPTGKGTGLGLSVVHSIVEQHQGTIDFDTGPDGTTFIVALPRYPGEHSPASLLSGAILAGGKSSRMGTDKAWMDFRGKPLIQRALSVLKDYVDDLMIIANQTTAYEELGYPVYPDTIPGCGPLGGIYTALQKSRREHCLVLACDLPFVTQKAFALLQERMSAADVVLFQSESGLEPLCAIYHQQCLPVIEQQLQQGDYKIHNFLQRVQTTIIDLREVGDKLSSIQFTNLNSPEDIPR
ncbi:MAG: HAMP domain-containing protein [Candidatus Neomarinimicrobiota bacterium]|nr:MAG: HAMP domain-containing protein [Candidatus Neomarinimicrobiota bacterium]